MIAPCAGPPAPGARVVVIANPTSGQAEALAGQMADALAIWRRHGWLVDLVHTRASGDATHIAARAAAAGVDLVIAAGGDGTLNEALNGLVGSDTALGPLPIGTVNVWARELALPRDIRALAEFLPSLPRYRVDVGRAGTRWFLLMAGIGFDAAVVAGLQAHDKRRLGILAYAMRAFAIARQYRGVRVRMVLDGRVIRRWALMIVLGNTPLYGGVMQLTEHARVGDGVLDVCIIRGSSIIDLARAAGAALLLRRASIDPRMEHLRARDITIETRRPLPVQVDGDLLGETPMQFTVADRALTVLMPPARATAHFAPPTPMGGSV
jgi:YegS/Rv2252/BmrU family lipid kinase